MPAFLKGREKSGGRRTGSRHRISTALLEAFAKDFEQHGEDVIRIARVEKPVEYLRIATSLIPQSIEVDNSQLGEISDAELDALIDWVIRQRRASAEAASGEASQVH